jgi:2-phospho-L-lactate guanylyltransferase
MADAGCWSVVVPVKRTSVAKSRLRGPAAAFRRDLALAFAADTVAAAARCRRVNGVLVVTDDAVAREVLAPLGAVVVPDEPGSGLNPALLHGAAQARRRWPTCGVALLSADLPALRAGELERALAAAEGHPRAFVCDTAGTGTVLVTAATSTTVACAFGRRSRARHRVLGLSEVDPPDIPGLRRDVDTDVDLADAERLGVGAATRAVLTRMADAASVAARDGR